MPNLWQLLHLTNQKANYSFDIASSVTILATDIWVKSSSNNNFSYLKDKIY